jgi:transposase-like protein
MFRNSTSGGTASRARLGGRQSYVKIKGRRTRWTYLYRAVGKEGKTVDFVLRAKRDVAAAKAFFRRALRRQERLPHKLAMSAMYLCHGALFRELRHQSDALFGNVPKQLLRRRVAPSVD